MSDDTNCTSQWGNGFKPNYFTVANCAIMFTFKDINPIYTTEKIGKARMKIGKGNFHFR